MISNYSINGKQDFDSNKQVKYVGTVYGLSEILSPIITFLFPYGMAYESEEQNSVMKLLNDVINLDVVNTTDSSMLELTKRIERDETFFDMQIMKIMIVFTISL